MTTYNFFKHCLEITKEKYNFLLNTPRSRYSVYSKELVEIMRQLDIANDYGEILPEEYTELKNQFSKYNFDNIPAARAALAKVQKMK